MTGRRPALVRGNEPHVDRGPSPGMSDGAGGPLAGQRRRCAVGRARQQRAQGARPADDTPRPDAAEAARCGSPWTTTAPRAKAQRPASATGGRPEPGLRSRRCSRPRDPATAEHCHPATRTTTRRPCSMRTAVRQYARAALVPAGDVANSGTVSSVASQDYS